MQKCSSGMALNDTNGSAKAAALVDARGLACPLPLLKAKVALASISTTQTLHVLATDAGSVRDFHSFCELTAHELIAFEPLDDYYSYIIRKG